MPFTLVHGLIPYFIVCLFTKSKKLRFLAFVAGMLPDLDGLPILFDVDLYYSVHHELFHEPIYGLLLAIPVAVILAKYFNIGGKKSFLVFSGSFILHSITDVLFTNWPVKLLWPFFGKGFSCPFLMDLNFGLAVLVYFAVVLQFFMYFYSKRQKKRSFWFG